MSVNKDRKLAGIWKYSDIKAGTVYRTCCQDEQKVNAHRIETESLVKTGCVED